MPPWPVSTTTMPLSGTCRVNSAQMRSGRIGTASEVSAGWYFAAHSLQIFCSSIQALRVLALARSAAEHARKRDLGVAVDAGEERIVAAERLGSMSIWTAGVPICGTAQKCVVMPPVSLPMKQTRSAPLTTWLALSRE